MFEAIPKTTDTRPRTTKRKAGAIARTKDAAATELLTRDHMFMRCMRSKREGAARRRFLDISWIKQKFQMRRTHQAQAASICQFKQLADIDITEQPMEVDQHTLHHGRRAG
jgi:hypothetical protein